MRGLALRIYLRYTSLDRDINILRQISPSCLIPAQSNFLFLILISKLIQAYLNLGYLHTYPYL